MEDKVSIEIGNSSLVFETGKIARQANGSVMVMCEGSVVLATACSG